MERIQLESILILKKIYMYYFLKILFYLNLLTYVILENFPGFGKWKSRWYCNGCIFESLYGIAIKMLI